MKSVLIVVTTAQMLKNVLDAGKSDIVVKIAKQSIGLHTTPAAIESHKTKIKHLLNSVLSLTLQLKHALSVIAVHILSRNASNVVRLSTAIKNAKLGTGQITNLHAKIYWPTETTATQSKVTTTKRNIQVSMYVLWFIFCKAKGMFKVWEGPVLQERMSN